MLWLLVRLRRLRGTPFDPFGRAEVRRVERRLIGWYTGLVDRALGRLTAENHGRVAELAALPDRIRGYEQLKLDGARRAMERGEALLGEIGGEGRPLAAAS